MQKENRMCAYPLITCALLAIKDNGHSHDRAYSYTFNAISLAPCLTFRLYCRYGRHNSEQCRIDRTVHHTRA